MRIALILAALLATAAGCDKVKQAASSAVDKAQNLGSEVGKAAKEGFGKAKEGLDTAKEAVDTNGSVAITAAESVETDACYASYVPAVAGRRPLLQLRSYQSAGGEYPAVLVHAPVDADSLASLAGQTVEARMFVQDASGAIWDNVEAGPVTLQIDTVADNELKATLTGGQLQSTADGSLHDVRGSLTAVLK